MGVALATTAVSGSSCFFVAVAASAATAMDAAMTNLYLDHPASLLLRRLWAITMDATADADANPFLTKRTLPIGKSYGQGKRRRSISLRLLSFILM